MCAGRQHAQNAPPNGVFGTNPSQSGESRPQPHFQKINSQARKIDITILQFSENFINAILQPVGPDPFGSFRQLQGNHSSELEAAETRAGLWFESHGTGGNAMLDFARIYPTITLERVPMRWNRVSFALCAMRPRGAACSAMPAHRAKAATWRNARTAKPFGGNDFCRFHRRLSSNMLGMSFVLASPTRQKIICPKPIPPHRKPL
jgi:hypothetical protein